MRRCDEDHAANFSPRNVEQRPAEKIAIRGIAGELHEGEDDRTDDQDGQCALEQATDDEVHDDQPEQFTAAAAAETPITLCAKAPPKPTLLTRS